MSTATVAADAFMGNATRSPRHARHPPPSPSPPVPENSRPSSRPAEPYPGAIPVAHATPVERVGGQSEC